MKVAPRCQPLQRSRLAILNGVIGAILIKKYNIWFGVITLTALAIYITLTVAITEWRTHFRRTMNELIPRRIRVLSIACLSARLNINNEDFEARRYDESLQRWEGVGEESDIIGILNTASSIIAASDSAPMVPVADGVAN